MKPVEAHTTISDKSVAEKEEIRNLVNANVETRRLKRKEKTSGDTKFKEDQKVFLRILPIKNKLDTKWEGPSR